MMAQRWLSGAFVAGGALAAAGALLPWFTLYAGLYQYTGTVGLYGRLILAAGLLAIATGLVTLRMQNALPARAGLVFGLMLLAFSAWLYVGLVEIVHRPESVMIVARAGPGLILVLSGAALMALASAAAAAVRYRLFAFRKAFMSRSTSARLEKNT